MNPGYTTLAPLADLTVETIESYGLDARGLMESEGFDTSVLRNPNARFASQTLHPVIRRAVAACGDEGFGLRAASLFRPGTGQALSLSWFTSGTLLAAVERLARYDRFITTAVSCRFEDHGDTGILVYEQQVDFGAPPEALDAILGITVRLAQELCDPRFAPLRCDMRRPRPADPGKYEAFFGCPMTFAAQANRIHLKRSDLDAPTLGANEGLARECDQLVERYLADLDKTDYVLRARMTIARLLPSGEISEEAVARALNVGGRTLQRKLKQENTTYKTLLTETRHQLAIQHLKYSDNSITEIAFLLGFENTGNFSRAFKSWAGVTPTEYRGSQH